MIGTDVSARAARVELARRRARKSLAAYVQAAWPILNPGEILVWGWAMEAICDHVEAWVLGEFPFLLIEVPPGSSKSTIGSRCAPVWSWQGDRAGLSPSMKWMAASYNTSLSNTLNNDRRKLVESADLVRLMDTPTRLEKGQRNKQLFWNRSRGFMQAVAPGGEATGYHAHRHIYDDLVKPKDVTDIGLAAARQFMLKTMISRFVDQSNASKALIAQRLGIGDPNDVFADMHPDCVRLTIPALYDPKRSTVTVNRRFRDPRTVEGESFEGRRYNAAMLHELRLKMGSAFEAQYQQSPIREGGTLIKVALFQRYDALPDLSDATVIGVIDSAFTDSRSADDSALQIWAGVRTPSGPRFYLVDSVHGPMTAVGVTDAAAVMTAKLSKHGVRLRQWLIEAGGKGNGDAIVSMMRRAGVRVKPVSYKRGSQNAAGKRNRVAAINDLIENLNVYVPKRELEAFSVSFIAECEWFGVLNADDQVDCMTMALLRLAQVFNLDVSDMLVDLDRSRQKAKPKRKRAAHFRP